MYLDESINSRGSAKCTGLSILQNSRPLLLFNVLVLIGCTTMPLKAQHWHLLDKLEGYLGLTERIPYQGSMPILNIHG
jgi:hypothetical protein